ncbi:MAG TPA: sigma-54 dependent transcriptional regulator [Thermodesulfovibrionales bacterium]|jgi:DNA-binding NtrC family response regulator|nr:sigma-54 dependent transcriptional regulator [Thermodesulfovibrionales bacterium]HZV47371.1 sigma-54 dependent transcriptional regulator [Thermodesulfovibrionales bacterium]
METILVVEDKESMAAMLKETLEAEGYKVIPARDAAKGIKYLKNGKIDLVLTDLKLPDKNGIDVLKASKEENHLTPVIVMTAFGSVEAAVSAMKEGAFDFITKPFDTDHLIILIKRALETQRLVTENILLKEEVSSRFGLPGIIGKSRNIVDVAQIVQKVAATKTTVLILGESGTGKELFARAIHNLSSRKHYPFVPINCAAIPKALLESELFGHEKGSFTGADARKLGKFQLADKGTIFLDEIGDMDLSIQAKLLRAIEEGEIERVGAITSITLDVRIVAASNKDLEKAVEEKKFREDLFYRLNVFPVRVPPLRERKGDIPLLVEYFINKYCNEMKTPVKNVSKEALDILMGYHWKGNVRELGNTIERAVILCDGEVITPDHFILSKEVVSGPVTAFSSTEGTLESVAKEALRTAETKRISSALHETRGNKSKAAEILQVSYKTLLTKIKEYGIES